MDDLIDEFEEDLFNIENHGAFSEHRSEILMIIVPTLCVLFFAYWYNNRNYNREIKKYNSTFRIPVEEFEQQKRILTREALKNLQESAEYQQYLEDKKVGALKEVELTEDDKIVLSDDSDDEKEVKRKF